MKTVRTQTEAQNFFLENHSESVIVYNYDLGEQKVCNNYPEALEFLNRRKPVEHYNHIDNSNNVYTSSSDNYSTSDNSSSYSSNSDYSSSDSSSSDSSSSFDGGSGGDSGGGGSDSSY